LPIPLLVIDVGNSSTSFGLFLPSRPRHPLGRWAVPTSRLKSLFFRSALQRWLASQKITPSKLAGASISSVVPDVDSSLKRALGALNIPKVIFISSGVVSRVQILK
jgi:pantothenate kinase type III